ncbi:MAG TPA: histidine--tRNA ligase [Verrucomicrobiae bacterium]|jgi:histidyl-tRNA synthetase|nr:histidine--tRNA ligase [Verrucomicrobiae bacterium]
MEHLPGFRDFFPEPPPSKDASSFELRSYIFAKWRETARRYGFREYDGPPLEPLELFTTKSGTEIVAQLYNFLDKGDRAVALRPEMTPTLARMVAASERNYKKPIKWFAIPQLFRYERQQKGRLREHFQFNADIFGENDPAADAELIALMIDSLRALGLTEEDFVVRVSSRNAWQAFFAQRCQDAAREYDFYQIIDKMEREQPEVTDQKLLSLGISSAEVKEFVARGAPTPELQTVLNHLASRQLDRFVRIDYNIIRGLAYYTGIVFEAFAKGASMRAIAGGGRYNNLVKLISGGKVDLPGLGFGMGDVVLADLLQERKLVPKLVPRLDVFVLIEDETERAASLGLVQQLREAGLAVDYSFVSAKSDKQFKRAQELHARFLARCFRKDGQVFCALRDLRQAKQTEVPMSQAVEVIVSGNFPS